MGIHKLWQVLDPFARPTNAEAWRGKRVAIDASVWVAQFRAVSQKSNHSVLQGAVNAQSAHMSDEELSRVLEGFLLRILKLLWFDITPVFVFDGPTPAVKLREQRRRADTRAQHVDHTYTTVAAHVLRHQLLGGSLACSGDTLDKLDQLCLTARKRNREREEEATAAGPSNAAVPSSSSSSSAFDASDSSNDEDAAEDNDGTITRSEAGIEQRHRPRRATGLERLYSGAVSSAEAMARANLEAPIRRFLRTEAVRLEHAHGVQQLQRGNMLLAAAGARPGTTSTSFFGSRDVIDGPSHAAASNTTTTGTNTGTSAASEGAVSASAPTGTGNGSSLFPRAQLSTNASRTEAGSIAENGRVYTRNYTAVISPPVTAAAVAAAAALVVEIDSNGSRSPSVVTVDSQSTSLPPTPQKAPPQPRKVPQEQMDATNKEFSHVPSLSLPFSEADPEADAPPPPMALADVVNLLDLLGITVVQAPSEADAQLAYLGRAGLVDAVLTEDSDVVARGAPVVLRHFFSAQQSVAEYRATDLSDSGLTAPVMMGLGLLLGCDYCPAVRGLGLRDALRALALCWPTDLTMSESESRQKNTTTPTATWHALHTLRAWLAAEGPPGPAVCEDMTVWQLYGISAAQRAWRKKLVLPQDEPFPSRDAVVAFFRMPVVRGLREEIDNASPSLSSLSNRGKGVSISATVRTALRDPAASSRITRFLTLRGVSEFALRKLTDFTATTAPTSSAPHSGGGLWRASAVVAFPTRHQHGAPDAASEARPTSQTAEQYSNSNPFADELVLLKRAVS